VTSEAIPSREALPGAVWFSVVGTPTPQGSKKAITLPGGTTIVREQAGDRLTLWRHRIDDACRDAFAGRVPFAGPVAVVLNFEVVRPKNHYTAKGALKASAPTVPTAKTGTTGGDLDKYLRAALDAMTGVAFVDDCQVVTIATTKRWALDDQPGGLSATVWETA